MRHIEVDRDDLARAQVKLSDALRHAAEIMKLAVRADPADGTWGVLGKQFFEPAYELQAKVVYEHLKAMGAGLHDQVEALTATDQGYEKAERDIEGALKGIDGMLGEKRW